MRPQFIILITLIVFLISACERKDPPRPSNGSDIPVSGWLVPEEEIWNGPHNMDIIPSIDYPVFDKISNVNFLNDNELALVYQYKNEIRIYPHRILNKHEIVNDIIADHYFAITYCPLTGSGLNWNRKVYDSITEFGVSGMLYRSNLIPYDRNTQSYWSQMLMLCVYGDLIKTVPEVLPLFETNMGTIRSLFPEAKVLIPEDHQQLQYKSEDIPLGDRVFGVIVKEKVNLFPYDIFGDSIRVINKYFNKKKIIVAGSKKFYFATAFVNNTDNPLLEFNAVQANLPVIIADDENNTWDLFGRAVDGPRKGEQLEFVSSYVAYYYAWKNLFENIEIE